MWRHSPKSSLDSNTSESSISNLPRDEQDANISGTKIEPLSSDIKLHNPHSTYGGVVGEELDIQESRIDPLRSRMKYHHHTNPHADSSGVIGREEYVEGSKIGVFDTAYKHRSRTQHETGLDDESVDRARIRPLGEVREDGI